MPTYFFRNTGDTNWGTATNWSLTDGGGATGQVPLATDIARFSNNSGNCTVNGSNRVCGYSKGSLIVEKFLAVYGIDKYKEIIKLIANTPNKKFAQAFKETTGVELQAFYDDAQIFLKSRGWA